jgi:DNA-binding HxlR family transcriptional regulator
MVLTKKRVFAMQKIPKFTEEQFLAAKALETCTPPNAFDPRIEILVNDLIGRVADKWTLLVLEVLVDKGELRFTRLSELVVGISQKMLTQTLRHMEREGLITRTVHPVVPPKVEYKLTELGFSLGAAFCGVWLWAEKNLSQVEKARAEFDKKPGRTAA